MKFKPFFRIRSIVCSRIGLLVVSIGLLLAVAAGGVIALEVLDRESYNAPAAPDDPDDPDDRYYHVPQVPTNPNYDRHPDDPGGVQYPAEARAWDERLLLSSDVQIQLDLELTDKRVDERVNRLRWDRTLASGARAHSADMAAKDYLAGSEPGTEPADRYADVRTMRCEEVASAVAMVEVTPDELPYEYAQEYENEKYVVALLLDELLSDDDRDVLLSDEYDAYGIGSTLQPVDDDGETVIEVYATVDLCAGYEIVDPRGGFMHELFERD